jgi:hypothetical protein
VATVSLEKPAVEGIGPTDLVLGYRSPRLVKRLAERSGGRLRVVDESSAYFRLAAAETEPAALYERLRELLRAEA